ncbi:hypothetical protein ACJX0J_008038, partial [Zea mays]
IFLSVPCAKMIRCISFSSYDKINLFFLVLSIESHVKFVAKKRVRTENDCLQGLEKKIQGKTYFSDMSPFNILRHPTIIIYFKWLKTLNPGVSSFSLCLTGQFLIALVFWVSFVFFKSMELIILVPISVIRIRAPYNHILTTQANPGLAMIFYAALMLTKITHQFIWSRLFTISHNSTSFCLNQYPHTILVPGGHLYLFVICS